MTAVLVPTGPPRTVEPPRVEVFTPVSRRGARTARLVALARAPLGIYTVPLLLVVIWQLASTNGWLSPTLAASPVQIWHAAQSLWQQGLLWPDITASLTRSAEGLAIGLSVGVVTGTLAGLWRFGDELFSGLVSVINTIPLLAILPLMIVWFGIGEESKVLLIAMGAFVPIYLNLFSAIRGVDGGLVEMARAAGAGHWRVITRVLLPGALPGFLVGLRFSLAYSVLGLVAAEQVNADSGIGFMINQAQTYERVDQIYLGIAIYAVLGLTAHQVVRLLERVLLAWRPSYAGR
jgi:sulfonate transport system permease protein